jgi:hypothetical protein
VKGSSGNLAIHQRWCRIIGYLEHSIWVVPLAKKSPVLFHGQIRLTNRLEEMLRILSTLGYKIALHLRRFVDLVECVVCNDTAGYERAPQELNFRLRYEELTAQSQYSSHQAANGRVRKVLMAV